MTVARWLGHSSPSVTFSYYAHFMPEAGNKRRTGFDGMLGRQGDLHASRNSPDFPQGRVWLTPCVCVFWGSMDCKVEWSYSLGKC
ncbi:hypothetical protein [Streptomyces sp. C10]|uniref:hypothetical protein n=1 Tax=Streptomyces sp. C10 TaxID=531941 RepID=UPI0039803F0F